MSTSKRCHLTTCRDVPNGKNYFVLTSFRLVNLFGLLKYSGVRVIASRILHEICLLVGELAIRGT